MNLLEAIFLGILQGITEFLPISSTAHLTIAGRALGLIDDSRPEAWTAFLAVVQLGSLIALLIYFRRDLAALARGDRDTWKLAMLVATGTVPIVIVALALRDTIEGPLTKDLRVIAIALIGLGILLAVADKLGTRTRDATTMRWPHAIGVGLAQIFSLIPGSSRSGTTITGGLLAGLTRESAARFSFLLGIPAIAASGLFELPAALNASSDDITALIVATIAAALASYAAIAFMLRYLRTRSLMIFAGYRIVLGAAILGAIAVGWL